MIFGKVILLLAILYPFVASTPLPEETGDVGGRIVGGYQIDISRAPYQVALLYYGNFLCGGAIFSSKAVVTAAHCTNGRLATYMSVRAGSSQHASGGEVVGVSKINQHPRYHKPTTDYDISVLVLKSALTMGLRISLATSLVSPGTTALVTGWGATSEGGSESDNLMAVRVPIIDQILCISAYYGNYGAYISDRMICAGFLEGGKDACQGDSGGPMIANGELVGIVSWGYGCARRNLPGVYTNVYYFRDFILNNST